MIKFPRYLIVQCGIFFYKMCFLECGFGCDMTTCTTQATSAVAAAGSDKEKLCK